MGDRRGAYKVLVGRPHGRPRCGWQDNNKMDLKEVGGGMDWIALAQHRDRWQVFLNAVMNLWVP